MLQEIERIMFTDEQIQARVAELRAQLANDYDGKDPIFLGVLKGAIPFFKDITSSIPIKCCYDFVCASSYGANVQTSGKVDLLQDITMDVRGRHIVILEDILDTGTTLKCLKEHLQAAGPASLKLCVLLDKPERRTVDIQADYVGFTIPNEFVVGYGLDYDQHYRNLPYVGILKSEVYSK